MWGGYDEGYAGAGGGGGGGGGEMGMSEGSWPDEATIMEQFGGGPGADAVKRSVRTLQEAGVQLDTMALQALTTLPSDHALEMLEYVSENQTYLRNPSKYISSTVSRGFVPRRSGSSAPAAGGAAGGGGYQQIQDAQVPWKTPAPSADIEKLLSKAQEAGVVLSGEAVQGLSNLPPEHATELLEFVLEKQGELRDPSNYIASTIARGFKSRRGGPVSQPFSAGGGSEAVAAAFAKLGEAGVEIDEMAKSALAGLPHEHATEMLEYVLENHGYLRNPSNYISSTVARGFVPRRSSQGGGHVPCGGGKGGGKGGGSTGYAVSPVNPSLVPTDVTPLERRVLNFNSQHQVAQQIDFVTYLSLRSVPQWQSSELMDSLEAKSGVISSPINYIQAAVTKIQRGQGYSSGGGGGGGWGSGGGGGGDYGGKDYGGKGYGGSQGAEQQSFKRQRMW